MDVVKLPDGQIAGPSADCIRIQERPDGRFELIGSALMARGDGDGDESVTIFDGEGYASYDAAENAGLAWAEEHGVSELYVTRSKGSAPLPDPADDA